MVNYKAKDICTIPHPPRPYTLRPRETWDNAKCYDRTAGTVHVRGSSRRILEGWAALKGVRIVIQSAKGTLNTSSYEFEYILWT